MALEFHNYEANMLILRFSNSSVGDGRAGKSRTGEDKGIQGFSIADHLEGAAEDGGKAAANEKARGRGTMLQVTGQGPAGMVKGESEGSRQAAGLRQSRGGNLADQRLTPTPFSIQMPARWTYRCPPAGLWNLFGLIISQFRAIDQSAKHASTQQ